LLGRVWRSAPTKPSSEVPRGHAWRVEGQEGGGGGEAGGGAGGGGGRGSAGRAADAAAAVETPQEEGTNWGLGAKEAPAVGSGATEGGLAEGRDLVGEVACAASTHARRRIFPSGVSPVGSRSLDALPRATGACGGLFAKSSKASVTLFHRNSV